MQKFVECVTWPGILDALVDEIAHLPFEDYAVDAGRHSVRMPLAALRQCQALRCAQSVFVGLSFAVPRPRALLGQQYWDELIHTAQRVMRDVPFTTLELDAAGADSNVMQRISSTLATQLGLTVVPHEGEFVVRIRPSRDGWEVLMRLTPRPLGARAWRVCNMPGALNAVVAASMNRWVGCYADERVLNVGAGSGTLLIERMLQGDAQAAWGCDVNAEALACAQRNAQAAGVEDRVTLTDWDATKLPLPAEQVDVVMADLPFGQLIGSHDTNIDLYPAMLQEATRVLVPRGRMVLISHEVRLLQRTIAQIPQLHVVGEMQVQVGGMHPVIILLQSTP